MSTAPSSSMGHAGHGEVEETPPGTVAGPWPPIGGGATGHGQMSPPDTVAGPRRATLGATGHTPSRDRFIPAGNPFVLPSYLTAFDKGLNPGPLDPHDLLGNEGIRYLPISRKPVQSLVILGQATCSRCLPGCQPTVWQPGGPQYRGGGWWYVTSPCEFGNSAKGNGRSGVSSWPHCCHCRPRRVLAASDGICASILSFQRSESAVVASVAPTRSPRPP
jgi:hypothetical protein